VKLVADAQAPNSFPARYIASAPALTAAVKHSNLPAGAKSSGRFIKVPFNKKRNPYEIPFRIIYALTEFQLNDAPFWEGRSS